MTKRQFNEKLWGVYHKNNVFFKDRKNVGTSKNDRELVSKLLAYNATIAKVCEFNSYEA